MCVSLGPFHHPTIGTDSPQAPGLLHQVTSNSISSVVSTDSSVWMEVLWMMKSGQVVVSSLATINKQGECFE